MEDRSLISQPPNLPTNGILFLLTADELGTKICGEDVPSEVPSAEVQAKALFPSQFT
jgi:hypothetical protein